jgi:uncharacterized damage-inducible protein DinB
MINFFAYNWQIRDDWFHWCNQLTMDELLKDRRGGVGNILYTLFHLIDVEYSWIRAIQGKEDVIFQFTDYHTLEKVKSLSDTLRMEVADFLKIDLEHIKHKEVYVSWDEETFTVDAILHHLIIHEIHHIGQLSIWARELEQRPVSANFIGRALKSVHTY